MASMVALLLGVSLVPSLARADWRPTGEGTCNFQQLRSVELIEAIGSSAPILVVHLPSVEGDLVMNITAFPLGQAKDGRAEIGSISLAFGGTGLLVDDRVSIDGELVPVEPNSRIDTGRWRASSENALRQALHTGARLEVELVRAGKLERRAIELAPLQSALTAAAKSNWRCR